MMTFFCVTKSTNACDACLTQVDLQKIDFILNLENISIAIERQLLILIEICFMILKSTQKQSQARKKIE